MENVKKNFEKSNLGSCPQTDKVCNQLKTIRKPESQ